MAAVFGRDFSDFGRKSESLEKCRDGAAQCFVHDQFGWRHCRIHGAQPTAKAAPDLSGVIDGKVL